MQHPRLLKGLLSAGRPRVLAESAAFGFICFVASPVLIIYLNRNLWNHDLYVLIYHGLVATAIVVAVVIPLLLIGPILPFLSAILAIATVFLFVMAVFYPHDGNLLDGRLPSRPSFGTVIAVGLVLAALVAFRIARPRPFRQVFVTTCALSTVFVLFCAVVLRSPTKMPAQNITGPERLAFNEVGTDQNVFVILLDMLQGTLVEKVFQNDAVLSGRYRGFELYTRAVSAFPFTLMSVPNLLSGKFFNEETEEAIDVLAMALQDSFIGDARDAGFAIHAVPYDKRLPLTSVESENLPLAGFLGISDQRREFLIYCHILLASLHRTTKLPLPILEQTVARVIGIVPIAELGNLSKLKINSRDALISWSHALAIGQAERKLFIMHNMVVHAPVLFTRDGRTSLPAVAPSEAAILEEYAYALTLVGDFIDRLKALDAFDRSLIIVLGDHGHFISVNPATSGGSDFAAHVTGGGWRAAGMYNPAILLKRPNRSAPIAMRKAPVSLSDVRSLVNTVITGQMPTEVIFSPFDLEDDVARENTVFVARKSSVANFWFTGPHERLTFRGNVSRLPEALQNLKQSRTSENPVSGR